MNNSDLVNLLHLTRDFARETNNTKLYEEVGRQLTEATCNQFANINGCRYPCQNYYPGHYQHTVQIPPEGSNGLPVQGILTWWTGPDSDDDPE